MNIIASLRIPEIIIEYMKKGYNNLYQQIQNYCVELNCPKELDTYYFVKDLVREFYKNNPGADSQENRNRILKDKYYETFWADYDVEECSSMDLLEFTGGDLILRNTTDLDKSYDIEDCPECWEFTKIKQKAPLYFSGEIFYPPLDPEEFDDTIPTVDSDTLYTDFGEVIVSENVKNIMEKNNVTKGVEFEKVEFTQSNAPTFYQWKIKHKTGKVIYPNQTPDKAQKRCPVCGSFEAYGGVSWVPLSHAPLESCLVTTGSWRNWSIHIEPGKHPDDDVLLSEERIGSKRKKVNIVFISPRLCRLLCDNGVSDFSVVPVSFW